MELSMGLIIPQWLLCMVLLIKECGSWPEGTYGIPMPKEGCPSNKNFQWLSGSRTQKTEPQSHASTPINLAGIKSEQSDIIVQNFCMKTSYPQVGNFVWGRGSYCIFKKGDCPKNFKVGQIYWDDAAPFFGPTIQNYSGTVPDGEYGRNTMIHYCCRRDGSITTPIILPTHAPFYLFRIAEGCQKVKNTAVTEEWVYWADEDLINMSGVSGMYPKVHRSKHPFKFTKLYYCYYVPQHAPARNYRVTMIVIYCISGIVSVFLLAFVITLLIQKCCTKKQNPPYIIENTDNAAQEAMISAPVASSNAGVANIALNNLRRNGAANRDNELDCYQDKTEPLSPPRYSQVNNHRPPRNIEEAIPMVSVVGRDRGASSSSSSSRTGDQERLVSMPPSYDDVIREKESEVNNV